jgi:hypothetical protein
MCFATSGELSLSGLLRTRSNPCIHRRKHARGLDSTNPKDARVVFPVSAILHGPNWSMSMRCALLASGVRNSDRSICKPKYPSPMQLVPFLRNQGRDFRSSTHTFVHSVYSDGLMATCLPAHVMTQLTGIVDRDPAQASLANV